MSFSPVLVFHISAGTSALLSGTAAMSFRKGSPRHRVAGNVFVMAMLGLSVSTAVTAALFIAVLVVWSEQSRSERGIAIAS